MTPEEVLRALSFSNIHAPGNENVDNKNDNDNNDNKNNNNKNISIIENDNTSRKFDYECDENVIEKPNADGKNEKYDESAHRQRTKSDQDPVVLGEKNEVLVSTVSSLGCSGFSIPQWSEDEWEFAMDVSKRTTKKWGKAKNPINCILNSTSTAECLPPAGPLSSFEELSEDIVGSTILSFLSLQEIANVSRTCTALYRASRSNTLWKYLFHYRWNVPLQPQHRRSATQPHGTPPKDRDRPEVGSSTSADDEGVTSNSDGCYDYFNAYRHAHLHPHDLWITHWNCTYPTDGLTPGRCFIPDTQEDRNTTNRTSKRSNSSSSHRCCPVCRISQDDESREGDEQQPHRRDKSSPFQILLPQITAEATRRVCCKTTKKTKGTSNTTQSSSSQVATARAAFASAATFHRRIRTQQYEAGNANFLTDLLFFNLTEPALAEGQWELDQALKESQYHHQQVLEELNGSNTNNNNINLTQPSTYPLYETSLHSWHVVKLLNPSWDRSIIFQVGIQRPDCFVVYPSEGFIEAGGALYVTFGVRPLGSVMSYAFESLNVQRDGLEIKWSELYTEQAHLPMTPIILRYRYATQYPIHPDPSHDPRRRGRWQQQHHPENTNYNSDELSQGSHYSRRGELLDYHRRQPVPLHHVRTIPLSAHVHAHYNFADFCKATCFAWDCHRADSGPIYLAPVLREMYPHVNRQLENHSPMAVGEERLARTIANKTTTGEQPMRRTTTTTSTPVMYLRPPPSHTQGPCQKCKKCWGTRQEEWFQGYQMAQMQWRWQSLRRDQTVQNIIHCLRFLANRDLDEMHVSRNRNDGEMDVTRVACLLYRMTCILHSYKASPWISYAQKCRLLQLEVIIDSLYRRINPPIHNNATKTEEDWIPWRIGGVYKYALCTESERRRAKALQLPDCEITGNSSSSVVWKEEPHYLDAFRTMTHSPGYYCLGPQEDPNHLEDDAEWGSDAIDSSESTDTGCGTGRKKKLGLVTDVFMDDPISALQAGICMMRDPRSLLVHGIYDHIPYPGDVIRRPRINPFLDANGTVRRPASETERSRLHYLQLQDILDVKSIVDVQNEASDQEEGTAADSTMICADTPGDEQLIVSNMAWSLNSYLRNVPPPGVGRFALSQEIVVYGSNRRKSRRIAAVHLADTSDSGSRASHGRQGLSDDFQQGFDLRGNVVPLHPHVPAEAQDWGGPRIIRLLWVIGARLGLAVIDSPDATSVFVDRNILIATQWISISLMAAPLYMTLMARYAELIPAQPIEYNLRDLPFHLTNEMSFLTPSECGYVALIVFFAFLALGRWTERHIGRDFLRVMMEHISPIEDSEAKAGHSRRSFSSWMRLYAKKFLLFLQRQWDAFCPMFLQRRVFAPHWNRRTRSELITHIAQWRSRNLTEQRKVARAASHRADTLFGDCRDQGIYLGSDSSTQKILMGSFVLMGSFCSSSPHFWLNLVTVFSCSISLGMSVSLNWIEKGRSDIPSNNTGSVIKALSPVTVVIMAFLVGQLVGSSGGTMFLAEFIVTTISLLFGGAGAISPGGLESWAVFFCLSSTAFWGYLFGRVALMDGIRQKRGAFSSVLLSKAVILLFLFWVLVFMVSTWDDHVSLMIARPTLKSDGPGWKRKPAIQLLQ